LDIKNSFTKVSASLIVVKFISEIVNLLSFIFKFDKILSYEILFVFIMYLFLFDF